MERNITDEKIIGIIGLGYVGLPLSIEFGKSYKTIGFDINSNRIAKLKRGLDNTKEVSTSEIEKSQNLQFAENIAELEQCNIYIVTVPTPVKPNKEPDLSPLKNASSLVSEILKTGDIVIYESTVYPGATREVCVPILEQKSGLTFNKDFFCGYSPERMNPGDKSHKVTQITKVTSGSTPAAGKIVDELYRSIIPAGTFMTNSIEVAEAAKVIENTQRDVNIALINEIAILLNKLGIDTEEVLLAAETKWNFNSFRPGLVGGHCIGVDPYYLTHKAEELGYKPQLILSGRRLNDSMPFYVAEQMIKAMLRKNINVCDASILIFGLAFKENCSDTRNSKSVEIANALASYNVHVDCYDPWVEDGIHELSTKLNLIDKLNHNTYDGLILAVAHDEFKEMDSREFTGFCKKTSVIYDLKHILPKDISDLRL